MVIKKLDSGRELIMFLGIIVEGFKYLVYFKWDGVKVMEFILVNFLLNYLSDF